MIPNVKILTQEITETDYPNRTYEIHHNSDESESDRISGYIEEIEAVKQAVYLILSTERYKHIIYSWDYGVELVDLFGKPIPYVMAELPRRIKEALVQDNRIEDVVDFTFDKKGRTLTTHFTVVSTAGNLNTELEVEV